MLSPADQFLVFVLLLFLKLSSEMLNNFLLYWHVLECFVSSRPVTVVFLVETEV